MSGDEVALADMPIEVVDLDVHRAASVPMEDGTQSAPHLRGLVRAHYDEVGGPFTRKRK